MADPNVEHLGVMAYAAYFQWVKARMKPGDRLRITPEGKTVRVHNPVRLFRLLPLDGSSCYQLI